MNDTNYGMTDPTGPPTASQVEEWIGGKSFEFWNIVARMIERIYPGVFMPEWLFGGKKHGWSLRYKKNRSFCTFIPEKDRFMLLIVFGANERSKVETIRRELSARTMSAYDEATTYHDGKWLLLNVDNEDTLADVERLLAVKRRPRTPKGGKA